MKIAHCQIVLGIAGSEKYLLDLLPTLNKGSDLEVLFFALVPKNQLGAEKEFVQQMTERGIEVITIPFSGLGLNGARGIKRAVNERSIDVLHTHLLHADFMAAQARRLMKCKVIQVSTKHGYEESYNNAYGFDPAFKKKNKYWRIAKWSEKGVRKSFAVSKGLQNLYTGLGICKEDRLDVIYHGFDFDIAPSETKENHPPKLVMVGRLTAFKGHRYAIEACKELANSGLSFEFDIVGSGELKDELEAQVKDLGLTDQIRFLGFQKDAAERMSAADLVLIPSVAEGFGVVVLEAMAAKTPIIAFDVPALNELIDHDQTGILVKPYDTSAYAGAIQNLIENREKSSRITFAAHKKLTSYFSLRRMSEETAKFYRSL